MRSRGVLLGLLLLTANLFSQSNFSIGEGAPTPYLVQAFIDAWMRNGFAGVVGPPLDDVMKFGTTGYIQEFPSTVDSSQTLALIVATSAGEPTVWQVQGPMFAYYTTVTESTAGYPTQDTQTCPALVTNPNAACTWQTFTNNYVLFDYTVAVLAASPLGMATRDPFYTAWNNAGGMNVLGPAITPEASVTSKFNSNATVQQFDQGAIYNITSGTLNGRILAVIGAIWTVYVANGADQGMLGLPEDNARLLSNGLYQQDFEGGSIQFNPATGVAQLRPPVQNVVLTPSGSVSMNVGATLQATAVPMDGMGNALTDRLVGWNTSNSQVVQIQSNGQTATITAVAGGTAVVTATVEGKVSAPLNITVIAPCCSVAEGIPTTAAQAVFQAAIASAGLQLQLPAATPAVRAGNGYIQQFTGSASPSTSYLVTLADNSLTAYFVTGAILAQYITLGGPAGSLGYPVGNATPGGRQSFQNGVLAGNPVQQVIGAILAKWTTLGLEVGPAGSPTGPAMPFQTFRGSSGLAQTFQNALIVAPTMGALAGQTWWVTGLVLTQYRANGGLGGNLGAPINDEHNAGNLRWQDFEGGYITYAPGATQATVTINPRQPVITVSPSTVISGSAVHLIAGGFNNGASVHVSQTGQPDFIVSVPSGSYSWDVVVPSSAASGTVNVAATDSSSGASAKGSYTVVNASGAAITITAASGDQQTGAPGTSLAQPLVALVQDNLGNPVAGQLVKFAASPGGTISPATAVTGADGTASAVLRMPVNAGIALATATVGHAVVTFSARSAPSAIPNFSPLSQNVSGTVGSSKATVAQKGALLAASASILRYYQSTGALPAPNGLADPAALDQFLSGYCAGGTQICDGFVTFGANSDQTVNLWRLAAYAANDVDVSVESTDMNSLRDLIFGGSPVLLCLSLNGQALKGQGSHFVVATGISPTGDILIADPNPAFNQTLLGGYTVGFTDANGNMVQGTLVGAARLVPRAPSASQFLVIATAPLALSSVSGACGATLQFPDTAAVSGVAPVNPPGTLYFRACAGTDQGPYELDVTAQAAYSGSFTMTAAANASSTPLSGTASTSSLVVHSGSQWTLAPMTLSIASGGVINAASFTPQTAPGGLISIFGTGFTQGESTPTVTVNTETAAVLAALPFQINAQIPADTSPGQMSVSVAVGSRLGLTTAQQAITVSQVAPAIFSISSTQAAVTNQDNSLNTPSNSAARGSAIVIYATGLGAVGSSGGLNPARAAVTALIGGTEVPTVFAGLTPGFIGLYQANVIVPASLPPGLSLSLALKQNGVLSNTVSVAIQ